MDKELVLYGRRFSCTDQSRAIAFLTTRNIPYRFIDIGADSTAAERLESWVGYLSVPTIIIAQRGEILPVEPPAPLGERQKVRGQNRGTMITEPNDEELASFLVQHGFMQHS